MTMEKMKVEIWSDVTCPSCYISKRKFETALSQFKDSENIEVTWKSFELAPGLHTDPGNNMHNFLAKLHGIDISQSISMCDQVAARAAESGLKYDFAKAIPANTFNAHILMHLAKVHGVQAQAKESLSKAYFTDGRNIDDPATLSELGEKIGISSEELISALKKRTYSDEVTRDKKEAEKLGIRSVPHFIFDGKIRLSGEQDSNVFLESLEKTFAGWQENKIQAGTEIVDGPSCGIGMDCK
jgi:predicted DsbA family dithiol-disulfide isomerase